jgi:CrcB protein
VETIILIGLGGFLGAALRYLLSDYVQNLSGSVGFPYGTLAVNVIGCFLIGFFIYFVEFRGALGPQARAFLLIGVLGALTTFSTFGSETLGLLRGGETFAALGNVAANNLLGLGAVWLGYLLGYGLGR